MKFDVLHNFISPVTGRVLADFNYVLYGNRQGIAIPSPILIDIRLDLINLRKNYNSLLATDFVIGHASEQLPNAQVLVDLDDGFLYNTDGTVSTKPTSPKLPLCYAASTANLTVTYDNGTGGIGATLTNSIFGVFSIDGITPPINSIILIKDQSSTFQNGIYVLTNTGSIASAWVLTRSIVYDQPGEIQAGDLVAVLMGTINASTIWIQTEIVNVIGTDAIEFVLINLFNILPEGNIWIGNSSNLPIPNPRIALTNLPTFLSLNPTNNFGLYNLYTGQVLSLTNPLQVAQPTTTLRIDMSNMPNLTVGKFWIGVQDYTPPLITFDGIPPYVHITGTLNWDALGFGLKSHGVPNEIGLDPMQLFIGSIDPMEMGQITTTTTIYIDNLPDLTYKGIWRGDPTNRPIISQDLTTLEEVTIPGIEEQIAALEAEIAALEAEIVALEAEIVEIQGQIIVLGASVAILQGQILIIQGQIAALNGRIDALRLNNISADGDVSFYGFKLINLADPINPTDGANKEYVDSIVSGAAITFKDACYAGSTANLNATYSNGSLGVGATLTNAGSLSAFTIDGTSPSLNARILIKNQTSTIQNGIYTLTTIGSGSVAWVLTRSTDFDQASQIVQGDFVIVANGTINANIGWVETSVVNIIGTDAISFVQLANTADAPANATYIIQTTNAALTNAQVLASLSTGLVKNTTSTGVLSIGVPGVDYYSLNNPTTLIDDFNLNGSPLSSYGNIAVGTLALNSLVLNSSTNTFNTAIGSEALYSFTTGHDNTAVGQSALFSLISGNDNTAFGSAPLSSLTSGNDNSVFGLAAALSLVTGDQNCIFGSNTFPNATSGSRNVMFGYNAGQNQSIYNSCCFLGPNADASVNNLTNAIAIGDGAIVSTSNSMVLGQGVNVGIGISNPSYLLHVNGAIYGTWNGVVITPTYGGTGLSSTTAYGVLCGGTTSTANFQNAGAGTSGQVLTSSGASALPIWATPTTGTVTSVSGTAGQIDVATGTTTPVISIDSGYIGQSSITTLGTISSGTWHGSLIALTYGGTNANLTASNGGIVYSTASAMAILGGTATANQMLLSGANAAPTWSTVTHPSTTTINQLLYSSAANVISGLTTANNSILVTSGSGVPSLSGTLPFTLPIATGGTGITSTTAYAVLCGGTTSTGNLQNTGTGTTGQVLTSSGANALPTWLTPTTGTVTSVSGTAGQIDVATGTTTPVISIDSGYVGQTSITTLGTITTGTWNGTLIALAHGGTNANLTASNGGIFYSTASAGAILSGTSTANQVLLSGSSNAPIWSTATYPTTTTINQLLYSSSANVITGISTANNGVLITGSTGIPSISSTLPSAVQTNITSLGTISTGTWNGSLISLTYGGTNANLTASNGGIVYSTASAMAILAGTATANQIILSGISTTPSWSTATYPATTTINQLLYSSSANVIGGLATANNSVLLTNGSGVPAWQTLTSNVVTSLTGTANQITVSGSTGAITLSMPSSVVITTSVTAGNLELTGNTFQSNNTNGNITIAPNGTGNTIISTGNIGIGTSTPHSQLQFSNSILYRTITLYEQANNSYQYYGFGIQAGILVYNIPALGGFHVFYAGTSSTTSQELMRISTAGNGNTGIVGINAASPAAGLHVIGGVQNVATQDSCIRAESSSNFAAIELKNTASGGRLYEIRSGSAGSDFTIIDRTSGAQRFIINSSGNVGIGSANPSFLLDVPGTGRVQKLLGNANAPTVIAGSAAGSGATVVVSGSELSGTFELISGTTPTGVLIANFTLGVAMANTGFGIIFTPGTQTAAALTTGIWTSVISTSTFSLNNATTLVPATTYKWNYIIIGC